MCIFAVHISPHLFHNYIQVCRGLRLTKRDFYFQVDFDHFGSEKSRKMLRTWNRLMRSLNRQAQYTPSPTCRVKPKNVQSDKNLKFFLRFLIFAVKLEYLLHKEKK
jgi:hypothetical protein